MMYFERSNRQEVLAHLDFIQPRVQAHAGLYYDGFMRGLRGEYKLRWPHLRGIVKDMANDKAAMEAQAKVAP